MPQFTDDQFDMIKKAAIDINAVLFRIMKEAAGTGEESKALSGGMCMTALAISAASIIVSTDWDLDTVVNIMSEHIRFNYHQIKDGVAGAGMEVIHADSAEEAFDMLRKRREK